MNLNQQWRARNALDSKIQKRSRILESVEAKGTYLIEFLPYILPVLILASVGVIAAFKYRQTREKGIALMSAAFFISSIPPLVNLALGGPYLVLRLIEQGYSPAEIGTINLYLFAASIIFEMAFAILFVVGLFRLTRKLK